MTEKLKLCFVSERWYAIKFQFVLMREEIHTSAQRQVILIKEFRENLSSISKKTLI